jgi:hypothetical protein
MYSLWRWFTTTPAADVAPALPAPKQVQEGNPGVLTLPTTSTDGGSGSGGGGGSACGGGSAGGDVVTAAADITTARLEEDQVHQQA